MELLKDRLPLGKEIKVLKNPTRHGVEFAINVNHKNYQLLIAPVSELSFIKEIRHQRPLTEDEQAHLGFYNQFNPFPEGSSFDRDLDVAIPTEEVIGFNQRQTAPDIPLGVYLFIPQERKKRQKTGEIGNWVTIAYVNGEEMFLHPNAHNLGQRTMNDFFTIEEYDPYPGHPGIYPEQRVSLTPQAHRIINQALRVYTATRIQEIGPQTQPLPAVKAA